MPAPTVVSVHLGSTIAASPMSDVVLAALIGAGGVVLTAVVTITGVLLANWNSRKQLRMQLEASAQEAARQRHFEMRRTVYLEASEAIAKAQHLVACMADIELPNREIGYGINAAIATLAKIHVVGHPDTVRAVAEYQAVLNEVMCALWPMRWSLLNRHKVIEVQEKAVNAQAADKDRWLEQMKQANVQGHPDPGLFQKLQKQFDAAEELRVRFGEKLAALTEEQGFELLKYLELGMQQLEKLMEKIPAALTRSRSELEVPGEESELAAILTALKDRQQAATRSLTRTIQEAMEAQRRRRPPPAPKPPPPSAQG